MVKLTRNLRSPISTMFSANVATHKTKANILLSSGGITFHVPFAARLYPNISNDLSHLPDKFSSEISNCFTPLLRWSRPQTMSILLKIIRKSFRLILHIHTKFFYQLYSHKNNTRKDSNNNNKELITKRLQIDCRERLECLKKA